MLLSTVASRQYQLLHFRICALPLMAAVTMAFEIARETEGGYFPASRVFSPTRFDGER
jgi:hypothetical protein